jgi:prevent-host-death family protein
MTIEIDAEEAQAQLRALLDRVARGEEIVITQRGRAIARLAPVERTSPEQGVRRSNGSRSLARATPWTSR